MKSVAIVYHYLAHYRLPVFKELIASDDPVFTLISGENEYNDIKTIDKKLSKTEIKDGGLRWQLIKNRWIGKDRILWQEGIIRKCLSNEFDGYIFLGNPYFISTWVAAIMLQLRRKPVYFWTHGVTKNESGIKGFIRKWFYKLATGLFLYGNHAREILIKQGFNPEELHVIYNSLDYYNQLKFRDSLNKAELLSFKSNLFKNPDLPQLVFIGRLTPQKKLYQLIEAISLLNQMNFPINCLFVGEGSEKVSLEQFGLQKGIANYIVFYGASYNEETNYKLIASSDICVAPGEVGLTAMHSLVYGTPVITHGNFENQMPEFEAIQRGISGDFFEEGNVEALAMKIKDWLQKNPSKETVKNYCYSIIDEKYNPKYQKTIICNTINNDKASKKQ